MRTVAIMTTFSGLCSGSGESIAKPALEVESIDAWNLECDRVQTGATRRVFDSSSPKANNQF